MSKDLNYLNDILKNEPMTLNKKLIIESIKEKLQRLEAIDNAKSSEALECLEGLNCGLKDDRAIHITIGYFDKAYNTIKQALLKAQEQEKVLNILFEKNVQINSLKKCKTVEEYNILWTTDILTQEEFNLFKEVLK